MSMLANFSVRAKLTVLLTVFAIVPTIGLFVMFVTEEETIKRMNQLSADEAAKAMMQMEQDMLIAGLVALALAILCGFLIGGLAAKPLRRTTNIMMKLAHGDLQTPIPESEDADEVGEIVRTLQIFKDNGLKMAAMKTDQIAQEQLSKDRQRQIMQDLASGFEASVGQIVTAQGRVGCSWRQSWTWRSTCAFMCATCTGPRAE